MDTAPVLLENLKKAYLEILDQKCPGLTQELKDIDDLLFEYDVTQEEIKNVKEQIGLNIQVVSKKEYIDPEEWLLECDTNYHLRRNLTGIFYQLVKIIKNNDIKPAYDKHIKTGLSLGFNIQLV